MNLSEQRTCQLIEETLCGHKAFRKIDDKLYVVKQGSAYVMINVIPYEGHAIVRCVAQVVKGVSMESELALQLLELNSQLRFGAFAFVPQDNLVLFLHSILGGETLDAEELLETVRDVAMVADEWDDRIIAHYGGQRMQDLLDEAALTRLIHADPDQHRLTN
jgi:hypothetical protein